MRIPVRWWKALATAVALLGLTACGQGDSDRVPITGEDLGRRDIETSVEPGPADGGEDREDVEGGPGAVNVEVVAPDDGASTEGNTVQLEVEVTGIELVPADDDTSGDTGHLHAFVDRDPVSPGEVIPRAPDIVHFADTSVLLTGLSAGEHTVTVVVGDGRHARIHPDAEATVNFEVLGPVVQAEAPAIAAGEPLEITAEVEGIELVAADGDTSGDTGHLHVLVDRDLPEPGTPIGEGEGIIHTAETTITIEELAAGEHTIWVVVADGEHVPFEDQVADRLLVTVE